MNNNIPGFQSLQAATDEINTAIRILSHCPETDTAATSALIHASTARAFLRDLLAEQSGHSSEGNSMNATTQDTPAPIADRNTASKFNPFIGIRIGETMTRCEQVVSDLGYIITAASENGMDADTNTLFRVFEVVTAAMRFEVDSL